MARDRNNRRPPSASAPTGGAGVQTPGAPVRFDVDCDGALAAACGLTLGVSAALMYLTAWLVRACLSR